MCSQLTRDAYGIGVLRWVIGKSAFDFILMCVHSTASSIGLSFFAARSQLPKEQNSEEGNIEKWNGSLSENSREQK